MDLDGFHAWLHKRGRSRSADQYRRVVGRWLNDPESEEAKMTARRLSPNYRRFLVACIRSWAKYTKNNDLKEKLEDIKLPAPVARDVREPFELEEWFDIRDAIADDPTIGDAKKHVCGIIAMRGIRCGDVLRLTKRDISRALDTGTLKFESKGERWQSFSAEPLREHLEGLLACDWTRRNIRRSTDKAHHPTRVCNLICPGSTYGNAQATAGRVIRKVFDMLAEKLDMEPEDLYAHRFRHTYATYFLQEMKGDPEAIFKLQQQMGWARLDTAANYLRRSRREELDEVEERLLRKK
jgi:integrase